MSSKTIPFKQPVASPKSAEAWIGGAVATSHKLEAPTKRLTVDIPEELHTQIKLHCVRSKRLIADWLRELLSEQDLDTKEATKA